MSGAEQVQSFNPMILIIYLTNAVLLYWDYSDDGVVKWSIPVIGSIVLIHVYMIWKTNYDEMMEQERDAQARALGGPVNTPEITPGQTRLDELYESKKKEKDPSKPSSSTMVNINTKSVKEE